MIVVNATAQYGRIAAHRAAIQRQCSMIVVNAAAGIGQGSVCPVGAIRDGQAGDGGCNATTHVEYAAGKLPSTVRLAAPGPLMVILLSTSSSPVRQSNGASDSKVDSVAVMGVCDRLTQ